MNHKHICIILFSVIVLLSCNQKKVVSILDGDFLENLHVKSAHFTQLIEIEVQFNYNIENISATQKINYNIQDESDVKLSILDISMQTNTTNKVKLNVDTPSPDKKYYLTVKSIKGFGIKPISDSGEKIEITGMGTWDTAPPVLVQANPIKNTKNQILIDFSENILINSAIDKTNYNITKKSNTTTLPIESIVLNDNGTSTTVKLSKDMESYTEYQVKISGVSDYSGNKINEEKRSFHSLFYKAPDIVTPQENEITALKVTFVWNHVYGAQNYTFNLQDDLGFSFTTTFDNSITHYTYTLPYNGPFTWSISSDITLDPPNQANFVVRTSEDIIYVWGDYSGTESNGTSSKPFTSIQKGIDTAISYKLTEIRVAVSSSGYNESVVLSSGINLKGGYNATDWSQDIASNETKVYGKDSNCLTLNSIAQDTIVEGFSFYGDTDGTTYGLMTSLSSIKLVIKNCNFYYGNCTGDCYGIYIAQQGNLKIQDVNVIGSAVNGTGKNYGIYVESSNPTISNVNVTADEGSSSYGMYLKAAEPDIENCQIRGGTSINESYGLYLYNYSEPNIQTSTIQGDDSQKDSFGIYVNSYSTLNISNSTIKSGHAVNESYGIHIFDHSDGTISNSTITPGISDGTAIGISILSNSNSTISGNSINVTQGITGCIGVKVNDNCSPNILQNNLNVGKAGASVNIFHVYTSSSPLIQNNTVTSTESASILGVSSTDTTCLSTIDGNKFYLSNGTGGCVTFRMYEGTIKNNEVYVNSMASDVYGYSGVNGNIYGYPEIYNNLFHFTGNSLACIGIRNRYRGIHTITNNTFYMDCAGTLYSVWIGGSFSDGYNHQMRITNNIFAVGGTGNTRYGVYEYNPNSAPDSLENNVFWDMGSGGTFTLYYDNPTTRNDITSMESIRTYFRGNMLFTAGSSGNPFVDASNKNLHLQQNSLTNQIWWNLIYGGKDASQNLCGNGAESCGPVVSDITSVSRTTGWPGGNTPNNNNGGGVPGGFTIGVYEND